MVSRSRRFPLTTSKPEVQEGELFKLVGNCGITKTGFMASFASACPVLDPPEPFVGWVIVEFVPDEWLVEYVTFQEWVRRLGLDKGLSLEQMAERVFKAIWDAISPFKLKVRCSATSTAHPEAWAEVERCERVLTGEYHPHPLDSEYWADYAVKRLEDLEQ